MTPFLGKSFDGIISIAMGLYIVYCYYKTPIPIFNWFHKKKLTLVISIFPFLSGFITIYKASVEYFEQKLPSIEYLEKSVSEGILVKEGFIYTSPHGYQIFIPSDYRYTVHNKAISLLASKGTLAHRYANVIVSKMTQTSTLDRMVDGTIKYLKSVNPTYRFSSKVRIEVGGVKGIKFYIDVVKNDMPIKSIMAVFKHGNMAYSLMCYSPKQYWGDNIKEFETIVNTFTIKKE